MSARAGSKTGLFCVALAFALSACGGGGGSGDGESDETSATDTTGASTPLEREYASSYAHASVKAERAYEMGITGDGITVAIIDTGANTKLDALSAALNPKSISLISGTVFEDDYTGHGTGVSSIVAAARDGVGTMGVSYNSDLMIIKADEPPGGFNPYRLRQAVNYAVQNDADIINFSIAGSANPPFSFKQAVQGAVDAGILMVIAAGNSGNDEPEYPAMYAGKITGPGAVIAVGAVDNNNQIASFSNKAGESKDAFLVAPGSGVAAIDANGAVETVDGTSYAAPIVSAAAALLKEHAPNLTGSEIANILLQTAQDLGAPGIDATYGHGLLDIAKALEPFGVATVPSSASTALSDVDDTVLYLSPAFATAMLDSKILSSVFATDSYDREFELDFNTKVHAPAQVDEMQDWLQISAVQSHERDRTDHLLGQPGTVFAGTSLKYGLAPQRWTDMGHISTQGSFFSISSTDTTGANTNVTASVGLPLAAHMGLSVFQSENANPISEKALENPFLTFAGSDLSLAYDKSLGRNFHLSAGYGANIEASVAGFADSTGIEHLKSQTSQSLVATNAVWQASPRFALQATAGQAREQGAFLNSYGGGAFGLQAAATTRFAGLSARYQPNKRLSFTAGYTQGATNDFAPHTGLIRKFSGVRSNAFAMGVSARNTPISQVARRLIDNRFGAVSSVEDRIAFSVSQPLRVNTGQAHFNVPVHRGDDGSIVYRSETLNLSPSGRQIDAEISYSLSARHHGRNRDTIALKAGVSRHPGHDAGASSSHFFGIKLQRQF